MESNKENGLQSFVVCLHYLCKEAERENLNGVFNILQNALAEIGELANGNESKERYSILDNSVYYALEFLSKFSALSQDRQIAMANLFNNRGHDSLNDYEVGKNIEQLII